MAEVMNMPLESLDQPPPENLTCTAGASPAPPSPPPPLHSEPPPQRRRDRDPKERRNEDEDAGVREREVERHPNRQRGGDFYGRNISPTFRDRDYKRRRSQSPGYRDRRFSPPRRLSPVAKRYRREDYDRRASPRAGFGPDDRRIGHDQGGGYERGTGGRGFYSSNRPYGRSTNPPISNHQSEPTERTANSTFFHDCICRG